MLAIDDEKLPPPKPAVAAQSTSTHSWVECDCSTNHPLGTTIARSSVGTSRSAALIVVHARPPNLGTANVYGMRNKEPTRFGTRVRRKSSDTESAMPTLPRLRTTTVHSTHTENPMCSANIDQSRFRRATRRPVSDQK